VGDIDRAYLVRLITKVEEIISRKVRYLVYSADEFVRVAKSNGFETEPLLLWKKDE
jgi:hypothetical protein